MNGADTLIAAALECGIAVCFANPGTTELPLVLALDKEPGVRAVLCLHENVATGAADGYARMAGKPALCLLHLGPGLENGLTNLHNARRARSPIVTVIGEHATWHRSADPLLATPIADLVTTLGDEVTTCLTPDQIAPALRWAVAHAGAPGSGKLAHVIVPHDCQIGATDVPPVLGFAPPRAFSPISPQRVDAAAAALLEGTTALLLGGLALSEAGQRLAARIASCTGAQLFCDTFVARMERGGDLPAIPRLPYFPDEAVSVMRGYKRVILVGTRRPVAFFGYPGQPSYLTDDGQTLTLAGPDDDPIAALTRLADSLGAPDGDAVFRVDAPRAPLVDSASGPLDPTSFARAIARLQPPGAIVMDEALTASAAYFEASRNAPPFSYLMLTGGAIGQGPGAAVGAAIACPGRRVINLQSDGCGAYSVQAFWTQARERLDVITVIASNRRYEILNVELRRAGQPTPGLASRRLTNLSDPALDWVRIAEGFGVTAVAASSPTELETAFAAALARQGPSLIEAILA